MSKDFHRSVSPDQSGLRKQRSLWSYTHLDLPLLLLLLALCIAGLVILYSASGQDWAYVERQAIRMAAGFAALIFLAQVPPRVIMRVGPWLYLLGVALLVGVILFGVGAKGAQRWLALPGFRFQPSELMKLVLPIVVAGYIARYTLPPNFKAIIVSLILIAIPFALIMKQPDLGTSLLIGASGVFILLFSGIYWRWIFLSAGIVAASLPGLWMIMKDYQKQRVLTFLDPESDPLGSGWNIIQSKTAIGSGGLSGKGFLSGTQSQLDFLPESHTDFIIAVIGEELGMKGVLVLLALYLLIVGRGLMIAVKAPDSFSRMLAASITLTFFVYVFVNIGMVSGILPVVGVPLPMVSYGGTSIVTLMIGFGILMSIHTHKSMLRR
ncbi:MULTISPECIES: rod shape-determining protein RodA [unclassified Marinobacterium]|jgi:rod shape determining protein RodA|uniref:rod shape-determining protein RodA n=1 Tax=unclassified Marinobacterium TaxID=2644139 RepID=UPI00156908F7|nr:MULTISPECIES: rod shape-determining protein RodA [unclassified Marinobacterium]NRP10987.1 Rod shape-determining protein RodA [Marinobacterium sp. xm-g-48]NRP28646.1 Rod shape-determining protein RodA [Marinobacterium sp. xm-d-420]NRP37409.1 Rod shape-determining protein RodA [Marinobacterium sp. xm-d-579]NRP47730.1 Rod shape-determining protein RodA [Marinobacterium sp. xm-d-543]NRP51565.1 Rod shape-determining protein RodA [Marinobacterium sp. xm-v-242]